MNDRHLDPPDDGPGPIQLRCALCGAGLESTDGWEGEPVLRVEPCECTAAVPPLPRAMWHEDDGPALWWCFPVVEPPYCGTPLDDDFPDYVTHWTPIYVPEEPT